MTLIKINPQSSKLFQDKNHPPISPQQNPRPISFMAPQKHHPGPERIINHQPYHSGSESSQKQRACSGFQKYYQSPPATNRQALQEPLKVYFTTSPSKPFLEKKTSNQKIPLNLPPNNFYGIKK